MTAYAPLTDPTAVVGRRVVAILIDITITSVVVFAVLFPSIRSNLVDRPLTQYRCQESTLDRPAGTEGPRTTIQAQFCIETGDHVTYLPEDKQSEISVRWWIGWMVVTLLNGALLQGITGGSIGKLVLGVRVVRADGQTAGIGRCIIRSLLLLIDLNCCFLIGLVLALTSKGHRRLGDMAGGTWVVRRSWVGRPPTLGPGSWAPGWQPSEPGYPGAPSGYANPGYPGQPPTTGTSPAPWGAVGGAPTPQAPADGPIWDDARNTYIQYDKPRGQWVQWDDATQQWKAIDT